MIDWDHNSTDTGEQAAAQTIRAILEEHVPLNVYDACNLSHMPMWRGLCLSSNCDPVTVAILPPNSRSMSLRKRIIDSALPDTRRALEFLSGSYQEVFAKSSLERGLPNPLIIQISGTECHKVSALGKHERTNTNMFVRLLALGSDPRKNQPDLVFHEITKLDSHAIRRFFPEVHSPVTALYISSWVSGVACAAALIGRSPSQSLALPGLPPSFSQASVRERYGAESFSPQAQAWFGVVDLCCTLPSAV